MNDVSQSNQEGMKYNIDDELNGIIKLQFHLIFKKLNLLDNAHVNEQKLFNALIIAFNILNNGNCFS